jgi:ankyrin repeat protein
MDANLDIIQMNDEGLEPLHSAVIGDALECFEVLLKARGRKINYQDFILKKTKKGYTCLHLAVINGSRKIFYFLVSHIEILDDIDSSGRTALMMAIEKNNGEFIEILIQKGANINAVDSDGNDLIFYSVFSKNFSLLTVRKCGLC